MRKLLIAVALCLLPSPAALACKVAADYRAPTNLELVGMADLIMVAKVEELGKKDPDRFSHVLLKPVKILKGDKPGDIKVRGTAAAAPNVTPLDKANPSVTWGSCYRTAYSRGTLVVALMHRTEDGGYELVQAPFARVIEDVDSRDGLWVRAAREYIALTSDGGDLRAAAEARAAVLDNDLDDRSASLAIAKDLRSYLEKTAAN